MLIVGLLAVLGIPIQPKTALMLFALAIFMLAIMKLARSETIIADLSGLALTSFAQAQKLRRRQNIQITHKKLHWFIRGTDCLYRIEDMQLRNLAEDAITKFSEGASADCPILPVELRAAYIDRSIPEEPARKETEVTDCGNLGTAYRLTIPLRQPIPQGALLTLKHWWCWPGCFEREQAYVFILEDYDGGTDKLEAYVTFVDTVPKNVTLFVRLDQSDPELQRKRRLRKMKHQIHEASVRASLKDVADATFVERSVKDGVSYTFTEKGMRNFVAVIYFRHAEREAEDGVS